MEGVIVACEFVRSAVKDVVYNEISCHVQRAVAFACLINRRLEAIGAS